MRRRAEEQAAEEAMCSGESLSSVVMQQTGRLDCENRVRGILKSLGLDPFLYTVNGKEGVDGFFLVFLTRQFRSVPPCPAPSALPLAKTLRSRLASRSVTVLLHLL